MADYTLLFLSSAEISLPLLKVLHADPRCELRALICQPDRPVGRKQELTPPITKIWAEENGLEVYQPEKLSKASELLAAFREDPPDFLLTFAYGQILNQDWLDLALFSPLNIHTSLLPKYRGASPIQAALLAGEESTGLTLMKMEKGMDTGPIYSQRKILIDPAWNAEDLHDALAQEAVHFIPNELTRIAQLKGEGAVAQNHSIASHCSLIDRENGFVDFKDTAENIMNKWRAYTPWPGLWTTHKGKRLKLLELSFSEEKLIPAELKVFDGKILVGTQSRTLELHRIQIEGKSALSASEFLRGQVDFNGPLAS